MNTAAAPAHQPALVLTAHSKRGRQAPHAVLLRARMEELGIPLKLLTDLILGRLPRDHGKSRRNADGPETPAERLHRHEVYYRFAWNIINQGKTIPGDSVDAWASALGWKKGSPGYAKLVDTNALSRTALPSRTSIEALIHKLQDEVITLRAELARLRRPPPHPG